MDHDPSQSQPIVIPGHDVDQHLLGNATEAVHPETSKRNSQFAPDSFQTAHSFENSPQDIPYPSSVTSTHSQIQNNSYSHHFVNNFNNLRNPFTSQSPNSNFSPRADFSSSSQRNTFVESNNYTGNFNPPNTAFTSAGSRPSLLTSKLASSSISTHQLSLPPIKVASDNEQSQQPVQSPQDPYLHSDFPNRSSNVTIQPPTTSSHFKQSELVNSYTPYHNTPTAVASSYSSATNSIPTYLQHHNEPNSQSLHNQPTVSSSFPSFASRDMFPQTNGIQETVRPVQFSERQNPNQGTDVSKPLERGSFSTLQHSENSDPSVQTPPTDPPSNTYDDSNSEESTHLDIVNHPVDDLLLMLSALLQKIVEANDTLHPHHYHKASKFHDSNKFTANVLAFHGRNVPAISIHAYLTRILKYCPVTNEVFLTLLVYFDRIAKRANVGDNNSTNEGEVEEQFHSSEKNGNNQPASSELDNQLFVMDSYNIHRLIISGITVASKFFSDIFYKNSRYAKVGGLPLDELNHLELQFLLLLDFKLLIQIEELQRYADLLLKFWRKEEAKKEQVGSDDDENNSKKDEDGDEKVGDNGS